MTAEERARLVEQTASAWRPRDRNGGVRAHPAWYDLDDTGRREAFEAAAAIRWIEASLDREGLTSTARAVLARIGRAR
jgi:hypothetical protein